MDILDIKSPFVKSLVSNIAQGFISKKFDIDTVLDIDTFVLSETENNMKLDISGSIEVSKNSIAKLATAIMKGGLL